MCLEETMLGWTLPQISPSFTTHRMLPTWRLPTTSLKNILRNSELTLLLHGWKHLTQPHKKPIEILPIDRTPAWHFSQNAVCDPDPRSRVHIVWIRRRQMSSHKKRIQPGPESCRFLVAMTGSCFLCCQPAGKVVATTFLRKSRGHLGRFESSAILLHHLTLLGNS